MELAGEGEGEGGDLFANVGTWQSVRHSTLHVCHGTGCVSWINKITAPARARHVMPGERTNGQQNGACD